MEPSPDRSQPVDRQTALIGVDWGTSSLRAYKLDQTGQIIEAVSTDKGILHVENNAFAAVLDDIIGRWRTPGLPVILSGMIGSRQGWIEVPYLGVPATLGEIAAALVSHPDDPLIRFVPGLAQDPPGRAPDVMRGEETQIAGAIGGSSGRHLLVMPGTHSKWVLVEDGRIVWFATFMTGELFAILKDHSILGRLMTGGDQHHDDAVFEQGLGAARSLPGGLLQQLFSARTLGLFERVPAEAISAYLSGLLIGNELGEALGNLDESPDSMAITVIGASALAERYMNAIGHAGLSSRKAGDDAAARGHYLIAKAAKLLPVPDGTA